MNMVHHLKNYFTLCLFFLAAYTLSSCGGESNKTTAQNSDSTQTTAQNTETSSKEERLCFASQGMTNGTCNLIIKGEEVTGRMLRSTPKAGMVLYEDCNVTGKKAGNKLTLTFTVVDNDRGNGIGNTYEEVWFMDEKKLYQEEDNVTGPLKKVVCDEYAKFEAQVMEEMIPEETYEYDGLMDGKIKIKMTLTTKPNPEDKKEMLCEGNYYYVKQGKDKKIDLKGYYAPGLLPLHLFEMVGPKEYGKFIIDSMTDFSSEFTCTWVSEDEKTELETVFTPID